MSNQESMDFTKAPRIQSEGWNYGKNTKKRKTSINLDESVGLYLDSKKQETGKLFILLFLVVDDTYECFKMQ